MHFSNGWSRERLARLLPLAVASIAFTPAPAAWCQAPAELKGIVTDPSGAAVAGATVRATAADSGTSQVLQSDTQGEFRFVALTPGTYRLEIISPNFKPLAFPAIVVTAGQATVENPQLSLSGATTEVNVVDTSAPSGSYQVQTANVGLLGDVAELDTPYELDTIPTNLMDNQQVRAFSDVLKYIPSAQMEARGGIDVGRPQTRGFEGSVVQNSRIDGLNIIDTTTYPMEEFDRIEVQPGLGGSIYGQQTPSGLFNFILKHPTADTIAKINVDVDSPTDVTYHGDVGGHLGARDFFGYRLNALHTNGTTYVAESHRRRELGSGSLSFALSPTTLLAVNGSHFQIQQTGIPGGFTYGSGASTMLPTAPRPTLAGLSQPWSGINLFTDTESATLYQKINDAWRVQAGGLYQAAQRPTFNSSNTLTDNTGDYTATVSQSYNDFTIVSNLAYANGHLRLGRFADDLAVGTTGFIWKNYSAPSGSTYTLGKSNIYTPPATPFAKPAFPVFGADYKTFTTSSQSIVLYDTFAISKRWLLSGGNSYSWLYTGNFTAAGATSNTYNYNGDSPSVSLLFKPATNMSTYFTYATSVYQGDTAPATGVANPNQTLPPYRSKQYEAGYKAELYGIELDLAAYRMTRPFAYTDPTDDVYKIEGTQQNDGLDVVAKGRVKRYLNLFGGLTWLNPELLNTGVASTSGKQVVGVPRLQSNMLVEYQVTREPGISFDVNYHFTGRRAANNTNTSWAAAYNTVDLGARYERRIHGSLTTWRVAVTNVGSESYWASIFPASINGATGTDSAFLGAPRVVSASVQWRFDKQKH